MLALWFGEALRFQLCGTAGGGGGGGGAPWEQLVGFRVVQSTETLRVLAGTSISQGQHHIELQDSSKWLLGLGP